MRGCRRSKRLGIGRPTWLKHQSASRVWPHLEYAMEANALSLTADVSQLERVQRLATRLVRGLRHVPYKANSTSSHWNPDASGLTSSWPSNFSKVKFTFARLTSSSAQPESGKEDTPTDYYKDQAVFDAGAVPFRFRVVKYWNRLPAPQVLSPSVFIFKN